MKKSLNLSRMNPGKHTKNVFYKREGSDVVGVHQVRRQKIVKLKPDIAFHRERMERLSKNRDQDLRELRPLAAGPAAIFDAAHQPRLGVVSYIAGDRRRRAKRLKPVVEQPKPLSRRQAKKMRKANNLAVCFGAFDECQQVSK